MLFEFVSNTYCVVFWFGFLPLVYPVLPVSLDCPFLIALSVFSNVSLDHFKKKKVQIWNK